MKKVFLAVVVMFATVTMSSAQVFVGGGVGFDLTGGKYKGGGASIDKPSGMAFNFTPKVGYYLSDDLAIGLEVGLVSLSMKTPKELTYSGDEIKQSIFGWGVSAFARQKLVGDEKISLHLEGSIGIAGAKGKTKRGSTTIEGNPVTTFSIGVLPVVSYDLTSKLSIEASCDFLRLGFSSSTSKDADDSSIKNTTNTFGLGVNAQTFGLDYDDGVSSSNFFNVGLIFKF